MGFEDNELVRVGASGVGFLCLTQFSLFGVTVHMLVLLSIYPNE
jgi:hypothetical protein